MFKLILISLSESRLYKKWQTLAIIWKISDPNLETGSLKSGVSWTIWKSWQHCHCWAVKGNSVINFCFYYKQICKKYPLFKTSPFTSRTLFQIASPWVKSYGDQSQWHFLNRAFTDLKIILMVAHLKKRVLSITCYAWCLLTVNHQVVFEINW